MFVSINNAPHRDQSNPRTGRGISSLGKITDFIKYIIAVSFFISALIIMRNMFPSCAVCMCGKIYNSLFREK